SRVTQIGNGRGDPPGVDRAGRLPATEQGIEGHPSVSQTGEGAGNQASGRELASVVAYVHARLLQTRGVVLDGEIDALERLACALGRASVHRLEELLELGPARGRPHRIGR